MSVLKFMDHGLKSFFSATSAILNLSIILIFINLMKPEEWLIFTMSRMS